MKSLDYYDISPFLSEATAVFPGDQPFRRELALSFQKGDHLELSYMTTSLHIGAHADAPIHYVAQGKGMAERDLSYYMGPVQVISVKDLPPKARIRVSDVAGQTLRAERVLFHTNSFPDPNLWTSDFNSLSPELIEWLHQAGVILVGIDTPSIDPEDSKQLESHAAVARRDMAILEGIVLDKVPDGVYELVALPLKLRGADASPVRAILLPPKT